MLWRSVARTTGEVTNMMNRNPVPETRWDARVDPYWGGLWDGGSAAAWLDREQAEQMRAVGLTDGKLSRPVDKDKAFELLATGTRSDQRLAAAAVVNQWRTLSVEQLAAFTGVAAQASDDSGDVHTLFSAQLLDVGSAVTPTRNRLPRLVRTSSKGSWDPLRDSLDFDTWCGLTAGQPWRWGSQHARHNILTAEVGLRAAETLDVPLVLGEQLCAIRAVNPPGWDDNPWLSNLGADAMVVRPDGLRIMVETSASTSTITKKMNRWADLLLADATHSMVVVFLLAPHPSLADEAQRAKELRRAIENASTQTLDHVQADVASRMFVATWRSWFPGYHEMSDWWFGLRCKAATGERGDDRWEVFDVLDAADVPGPLDAGVTQPLLDNAGLLFGIPHWMRQPDRSVTAEWARANRVQQFGVMDDAPDGTLERRSAQ